jgi:hypothetical protein
MPTLTANNLINRAAKLLQDETHVRWPRAELLDWLNDGQRVIALLLPDAYTDMDAVTASSSGQATFNIPSTGVRLIDVLHNTAGNKRAVRQIDRSVLDTQYPNWRSDTAAAEAKHFAFDKRNPKVFYLYPPLTSGSGVEVVYSAAPDAVTVASESSTEVIKLDDVFGTAIVDFMVYRAYLKDAEYAANDSRAKGAYETFIASLSGKRAADEFAVPSEQVTIAGVRHTPYRQ